MNAPRWQERTLPDGGVTPREEPRLAAFEQVPQQAPFQRILLAMDASPGAMVALAWAARLARPWDARVIAAHVRVPAYAPVAEGGGRWWTRAQDEAQEAAAQDRAMEDCALDLTRIGVQVTTHEATGPRAQEILRAASLHGADLVVLGASRELLANDALGGVASRALEESSCSVLLARRSPGNGALVAGSPRLAAQARRIASGAGFHPVVAEDAATAGEIARGAGASLLLVEANAAGLDVARRAACSTLVWRA